MVSALSGSSWPSDDDELFYADSMPAFFRAGASNNCLQSGVVLVFETLGSAIGAAELSVSLAPVPVVRSTSTSCLDGVVDNCSTAGCLLAHHYFSKIRKRFVVAAPCCRSKFAINPSPDRCAMRCMPPAPSTSIRASRRGTMPVTALTDSTVPAAQRMVPMLRAAAERRAFVMHER